MGPVAQPVFKTGAAWQPHARSVRLRRRSFGPFAGKSPAGAGLSCFHVKQRRGYFCPKLLPEQAILEQLGIIKRSSSRAS